MGRFRSGGGVGPGWVGSKWHTVWHVERLARLPTWHDLVLVVVVGRVDNVAEVDGHLAEVQVRELVRLVDELGDLRRVGWGGGGGVGVARGVAAAGPWREPSEALSTLLRRSFLAFLPKTKSMASITFDLPEPFGPTIEEKRLWKGPTTRSPPYDLKLWSTILVISRRDPGAAPSLRPRWTGAVWGGVVA